MMVRRGLLGIGAMACAIVVVLFGPQAEARILIGAMTLFALVFATLYTRSPWRSTEAGKSLMFTALAIAAIGLQQLIFWWFGDYPGRDELRAVAYSALALAMLHRVIVLWDSQHQVPPDLEHAEVGER
ncbi:hypothetical protein [Rhodococcus sp. RDE2]|uniref:putative phage holin n=1 Tax=Rhodococcus sp. RDE2 TaxID=2885078 RepID=UPI001E4F891C|nr:hypothetical protein [Rhodococcus sp. RDE2]BDB62345.1 hypothetical protein RDE2_41390 [Rhodococcus sp. RDE2]